MQREVRFNDLFNATFAEIAANRTVTLLFLAMTVPVGAASVALLDTASGNPAVLFSGTSRSFGTVAGILAVILFGMVAQYWFIMAMLRRSLHADFGRLLPYLGISLLSITGVMLGIVLLVIPGLILATRWTLVTPLVLDRETPAMDSFVESWERTQSSAWSIFGVIVVLFLLMLIPEGMGQFLSDRLTGNARIAGWLIESLSSQIWTIVTTGLTVGAYRLLGDPHRELEEVFA
jgi:hypothetical protein